jgi:4-hydroxybenzoate polyprenyltransferase
MTTVAAARSSLPGTLRLIAADIKLAHSVFALPFAVLGAFMAGPRPGAAPSAWTQFAVKLGIVVVCMVLARTWAMLVNRLVDRRIDAANARTARRVFAAGSLRPSQGWLVALACAALFIAATGLFWWFFANPWPLYLSVPVLAWISFYSFTKRFTALCHLFLGGALAASPLAAAIAIDPESLRTAALWWLAGFVLLWVAGFDVIYALQDEAFDREKGLSSIPARLGSRGAQWAARGLHLGAALMLAAAWTSHGRLNVLFGAGVAIVLGLLVLEHAIVAASARRGLAGLNMAFFTVNGVVSCVLGALGVADLLL